MPWSYKKNEGNEMCQSMLQQNDQVVLRRSLRRLRAEKLTVTNKAEVDKRTVFDAAIKSKLGDSISPVTEPEREPIDPQKTLSTTMRMS